MTASTLTALPMSAYPPEDQAFYIWWYGHMKDEMMTGPLQNVDHSTARYIWDAAIAQLAAPAGYKLVPIEPTWDQCMAAIDVDLTDWWQGADSAGKKVMQLRECSAHDIYRAMIAAAPQGEGK